MAEDTHTKPVRVRFAPSPTGYLHIGNARTALFNYLFARHHNGQYVVRIEDTDLMRSKHMYVSAIKDALSWLSLESDEPLIFQSERTDLYKQHIEQLLDTGAAYWSDPATEEKGTSVVRFRVPREHSTLTFDDLIHGSLSIQTDQVEDFVIARSDGSPLYNFVVVVDDALMKITHVIRGDDHVSNTYKQTLLYQALGYSVPQFAHLPMILGKSGGRLSKRDAATSVKDYKEMGILPDALCNYLVRLGWSSGDREIFSRSDMIELFSLEDVNASNAMFDMDKLSWTNTEYLKGMTAQEIYAYTKTILGHDLALTCSDWNIEQVEKAITLYKERASLVVQLYDEVVKLYQRPIRGQLPKELTVTPQTSELLEEVVLRLLALDTVDEATSKATIKQLCKQRGIGMREVGMPLRYALTGELQSPSVFALLDTLGAYESIERIRSFVTYIRLHH